jgi:hypothetical protein
MEVDKMAKSNVKKEKWIREKVTIKYNVEKKRIGVEVWYENGKLFDVNYGAMNGNILWSNMIHAHLLTVLLKKIKDKAIVEAIIAKEKKTIKEQMAYRDSEIKRMELMMKEHKDQLSSLEKRAKMLEEFNVKGVTHASKKR